MAAAFAILLLERYRTPGLVLWLTAGVLAALVIIEFLAVEPRSRTRPRVDPLAVAPVPAS